MGYKIDAFEFDLARGCLLREGEEIHLRPKTFQVAAFLIANRDRLVSKEEIFEACWKDAAVTDDVLSQAITELRRALGDNPKEPQYVRTIPRRGFRFIGAVEELRPILLTATERVTTVEVREEISTEISAGHRWLWVAVAAILAMGALGVWRYFNPGLPAPAGGKRQVAVFRFTNQTGQADLDWMRDGLPDMLTTTLSRSLALDVLSRDQLSLWLGRIGDQGLKGAVELARRSQAQIAILGSFAQSGSRIRVEAQVYDGSRGTLLAADSLVADSPDQILTQVDQLAARLAGRLTASLPGPVLAESMTPNLEAYRAYSLGLAQADALHVDDAIEWFKKAIALDPDFDMAYARIGFAHAISAGRVDEGRPFLERAYQKSGRLTERDRRHVLAWYAIANQNYREAIDRYRELISAYPREMEPYQRLAQLLRGESLHEDGVEVLKQGLAIDADEPRLWNLLAAVASEMGQHKEALDAAEHYLKLAPGEANAYDTLGLVHQFAGDYGRSLEALGQALHLNPRFDVALYHRIGTLISAGRYQEALREAEHPPAGLDPVRFAASAAWIPWLQGRTGQAAAMVAQLDLQRIPWHPALLTVPERAAAMRRIAIPGRGGRWGTRLQFFYAAEEGRLAHKPDEMLASLHELVRQRESWGTIVMFEGALGDGYLATGHLPEAIAEYRRALKLYPGLALARFHLGQALRKSGDQAGAAEQFRAFLTLWKNADRDLPQLAEARAHTTQ